MRCNSWMTRSTTRIRLIGKLLFTPGVTYLGAPNAPSRAKSKWLGRIGFRETLARSCYLQAHYFHPLPGTYAQILLEEFVRTSARRYCRTLATCTRTKPHYAGASLGAK
jgi:hypothetical protein